MIGLVKLFLASLVPLCSQTILGRQREAHRNRNPHNASPKEVWSVLTSLDKYADWNPFIKKAKGEVQEGENLEICISPPNGKEMVFKPTVQSVIENSEFSWLGRVLVPGIFDGNHIFTITKIENGCLLVQKEQFSGILVPLLWSSLEKSTREGFELMNQALKQQAENTNT